MRASMLPSRNTPKLASSSDGSNIRVVVRCRGRNDREIKAKSKVVVDTSVSKTEIAVRTGQDQLNTKTYTVDRVFGPEVDQLMIFDEVVSPIVDDLFSGMNCTIFAYGQTGTGKTYTMSGDDSINYDSCAYDAGIIPRVLFKLFSDLESKGYDHSVSCSFVELYNEELKDLLVDDDEKKLRLFDDKQYSAANNSVTLSGLSENYITSAISGLKVLQDGLRKRQVAATKLNDYSSRSHTIFCISTAIDIDGTGEITKAKINLVDLAGSENIGKSGAENKRAREAGMINQSLLTLGRVINSLVDKSPHIPYRESKLTRLLQDSLGGRTKTCIVATISPALVNVEETISTLEYASRAKNIKNKPQINNLISKKSLLADYNSEMEKLRLDLSATRKKNGIYLDPDNYKEINADRESQKVLLGDQERKLDSVNKQLKTAREQFDVTKLELQTKSKQLQSAMSQLNEVNDTLSSTELLLKQTKQINEQNQIKLDSLLSNSSSNIISQVNNLTGKFEDYDIKQREIANSFCETIISVVNEECNRLTDTTSFLTDSMSNIDTIKDGLIRSTNKSQAHHKQLSLRAEKLKENIICEIQKGLLEQMKKSIVGFTNLLNNELEAFKTETHEPLNEIMIEHRKHIELRHSYSTAQGEKLARMKNDVMNNNELRNVYEIGKKKLERALQDEQKKALEEKEKLFNNFSMLFDKYTLECDARMMKAVNSTTNTMMVNSMQHLQTNSNKLSKTIEEIEHNNSMYNDTMSVKEEELNKQFKSVLRTVSSGNDRMELAAKQLEAESESVIHSGLASVSSQIKQLDKFLMEAGGTTEVHNEAINQGVNELCTKVQHSFKYLENHLSSLKGNMQVNVGEKEWGKELDEIWSLLQNESKGSLDGIVGHINELKERMTESVVVNKHDEQFNDMVFDEPKPTKRPLDDITNENVPLQMDIKTAIVPKRTKLDLTSAVPKAPPRQSIATLKKPSTTTIPRLRSTTTGRVLRKK